MYYVYALIDPRDGKPFYIGKGSGDRIRHHERTAKYGEWGAKCDRIREIWADKKSVEHAYLKSFQDEKEAYDFERATIADIGLKNLTNRKPGNHATFSREYVDASQPRRPKRGNRREAVHKLIYLARIAAGTRGFSQVGRWRFCMMWHEIPMDAVLKFKKMFMDIVHAWGMEWAQHKLRLNGFEIVFTSKVA